MPGFSDSIMYADNVQFNGSDSPGAVTADGQLLIGSTAAPHIKVGSLGAGTGITVTPGSGTITVATSGIVGESFPTDAGTAAPSLNVLNIYGDTSTGGFATNINTAGAGNTVDICLNNSISQPTTNNTGTKGLYSLGGDRFLHNYGDTGLADNNTFLGRQSGNYTITGKNNTGIGYAALIALSTGNTNTAVGELSLCSLSTTSQNTCVGGGSGQNLIGSGNTGVGFEAFYGCTGNDNVAVGRAAMGSGTASGANNIAIGTSAMYSITTGSNNTTVGYQAGNLRDGVNNTIVGYQALNNGLHCNQIIAIGSGAGTAYVNAEQGNIVIRNDGIAGESNTIRIGTQGNASSQQDKCFIAGITGVTVANTAMVTLDTTTGQLGTQVLPTVHLTWSVITANQAAAVQNGYFCNKAGTLTLSLPATSVIGDVIEVANINTALGVQFTQAANQQISIGAFNTTLGVGGTLTSSAIGDSLKIVCKTANTLWQAVSVVGNWTAV